MLKDFHGDFQEVVKELSRLSNVVFLEKEEVAKNAGIALTSQDARLVALDGIQRNLITVGYWIRALHSLKSECSGRNWEKTYLDKLGVRPGIYPGDSHRTGKIEDMMLYIQFEALVTLTHFNIDNLFYNTLRAVGEDPNKNKSFGQNMEALLRQAGFPKDGTEGDALKAFSQVRNSYHNNGIHRNADFHATVAGVSFDFNKGCKVECASWSHILHLLEVVVKVLGSILSSANIRGIVGEIKDDFASGGVQP